MEELEKLKHASEKAAEAYLCCLSMNREPKICPNCGAHRRYFHGMLHSYCCEWRDKEVNSNG